MRTSRYAARVLNLFIFVKLIKRSDLHNQFDMYLRKIINKSYCSVNKNSFLDKISGTTYKLNRLIVLPKHGNYKVDQQEI